MSSLSRGAALVDPAGGLLAADRGFLEGLGLAGPGAAEALRARAAAEPGLAGLLAGQGPDQVALTGAAGEPIRLERHGGGAAGRLLVLRAEGDQERLEHALRSLGLAGLAAGLSHDVNGPLNTMKLQLALLTEKLGEGPAAQAVAGQLRSLRDQVGRIAGLVGRFRAVVDPPAPPGALDLGALAGEALALLRHDLDGRGVRHEARAAAGVATARTDPARAARLVLALLERAAAATPGGGALALEVEARGGQATLVVSHDRAAGAAAPGYDAEAAAAAATALGGHLGRATQEGRERVTLTLPMGQAG